MSGEPPIMPEAVPDDEGAVDAAYDAAVSAGYIAVGGLDGIGRHLRVAALAENPCACCACYAYRRVLHTAAAQAADQRIAEDLR